MKKGENQKTYHMDMIHGGLLKKILLFALPLAASSILQQLFNAIDVAVVGKFASSLDQAAVGCNGPVINLMLNLFIGISVGSNVIIGNYLGQDKKENISKAVHTSILVGVLCGVFLLVIGFFIAKPLLMWMETPEDTLDLAVLYLRIYFIGMPFIMLYNFGAAVLRSIGDTKRPLYCLIASGILNAVLNMILVIFFHMGVAGVAIATVVSNAVSALVVLYLLMHEDSVIRLSLKQMRIDGRELKKVLKIGLPAGLQSTVFSVANVFVQTALNGFGSNAVAGSAVTMNYEALTYFITSAFAQSAVSFISQNYGARQYDRCKKCFWICLGGSALLMGTASMTIVLNGYFFAELFTTSQAVADYAVDRMCSILTLNFIIGSYEIGGAALRGIGYSMTPAVLTVFGTCALRLIWIYTVFQKIKTLDMLFIVYPLSWILTGVAVLAAYFIISRKKYKVTTV